MKTSFSFSEIKMKTYKVSNKKNDKKESGAITQMALNKTSFFAFTFLFETNLEMCKEKKFVVN